MIIATMLARPASLSRDELIEAVWPDPDQEPDYSAEAIKVFVHRANKALRKVGWNIRSWTSGGGYRLEPR